MYKIVPSKVKDTAKLLSHSLAKAFDGMEGGDYASLVEHFKTNKGASPEVVLYKGLILDGRHRYKGAKAASIKCVFKDFIGDDAEARDYVASVNLNRRHLTQDQKAIALAKLYPEPVKTGPKPKSSSPEETNTMEKKAEAAGVGTSTLKRAKQVVNNASKATVAAAAEGKISTKEAVEVAKAPDEKEALAEKLEEKETKKEKPPKAPPPPKPEHKTHDIVYADARSTIKVSDCLEHRPKRGHFSVMRFDSSDLHSINVYDVEKEWGEIVGFIAIKLAKRSIGNVSLGDYDIAIVRYNGDGGEASLKPKVKFSNVMDEAAFLKWLESMDGTDRQQIGGELEGWKS